ncbi:hypothetical protein BD770DRAFT_415559 [Pilaira anomala]|nr:hypothetical protein BD770DRAFT_415559 [Pilaira anomala]
MLKDVLVVVAYCLLWSTVDYLTGRQDLLVNVWVSASFGVSLPYLLLLACRFKSSESNVCRHNCIRSHYHYRVLTLSFLGPDVLPPSRGCCPFYKIQYLHAYMINCWFLLRVITNVKEAHSGSVDIKNDNSADNNVVNEYEEYDDMNDVDMDIVDGKDKIISILCSDYE